MEFNATKEAIVSRVSLTDLVGETVQLKHSHGRAVGLCPFHEESTPSFNVYSDHFYCFGCKASGDAIEFVRKQQGSGFIDALLYLGNKYGVDVSGLSRKTNKHPRHKNYSQALQLASDYYRQCLISPAGEQALTYLTKRQVSADDIRVYGLGYAPADGNSLLRHLRQHGIRTQDAQAVSLASYSRDFFRNRLMFPIHDIKGAVIGFAGRALAKTDKIKYINSRENDLFHKKNTLFGLAAALQAIADQKSVIVVEGYFDWLRLHKTGIKNIVCCMGTAFSNQHLRVVKRYIDEVILLFDGDSAGAEAAANATSLVYAEPSLKFSVCQLPAGDDPDSYLLRVGRDAMLAYLQKNRASVEEFFITHKFKNNKPEQYPQVMRNEIVPFLRKINSSIEKDLIINKIAEISKISVAQIKKALQQQPHLTRAAPARKAAAKLSRELEEFLGNLYYAAPDSCDYQEISDFAATLRLSPSYMDFIECMLANLRAGKKNTEHDFSNLAPDVADFVAKIERSKHAYATIVDHYDAIQRIIKAIEIRKAQSNINMLHTKLTDDNLHVLDEIRKLKQDTDKMHNECYLQED